MTTRLMLTSDKMESVKTDILKHNFPLSDMRKLFLNPIVEYP